MIFGGPVPLNDEFYDKHNIDAKKVVFEEVFEIISERRTGWMGGYIKDRKEMMSRLEDEPAFIIK
jgi:hypothetical protein